MPIANVKFVMMALVAVLAANHFPHKVDDLEGFPAINVPGEPGRSSSVLLTSNASINCRLLGG